MKTPITYYGGKQKLLPHILPLIPEDYVLYGEPFAGGAAVFFAKDPSQIEVINDTNKTLITFYRVAKTQFKKLKKRIDGTLHSRTSYDTARAIYKNTELFGELDIAWAVWVLSATSFSAILDGTFAFDKHKQHTTRLLQNKKTRFTEDILKRLENAQIESQDACEIIRTRDSAQAFFYCDPPYFNSDMGHYKGYTESDFKRLLERLSRIKGRFLLSSYPSEILTRYVQSQGWHTKEFSQKICVLRGKGKMKVEVLTANYDLG